MVYRQVVVAVEGDTLLQQVDLKSVQKLFAADNCTWFCSMLQAETRQRTGNLTYIPFAGMRVETAANLRGNPQIFTGWEHVIDIARDHG